MDLCYICVKDPVFLSWTVLTVTRQQARDGGVGLKSCAGHFYRKSSALNIPCKKEANGLFNNTLNTFSFTVIRCRTYSKGRFREK